MSIAQKEPVMSTWLWLYLPLITLFSIILIFYCLSSVDGILKSPIYNRYHYSLADFLINAENGLVEFGTVIVLFPAIIYGILCINLRRAIPSKMFIVWLFILTVACVYIAGEEVSWGQQIFDWSTPESIKEVNDQHETNFHNMSSWFDQKPRLFLELWVVVSGIIVPLFISLRRISFTKTEFKYFFWPPIIFLPTAMIIVAIKLFDNLEWIDPTWFIYGIRPSEVQELYFAYYLMLYLLLSFKRIKEVKPDMSDF